MKIKPPDRIKSWLRYEGARCKPSTLACYRTILSRFCTWLDQKNPGASLSRQITLLTKSNLQDYLAYLNEQNLGACTRVHYLLAVKKYLQWEAERGVLNEDILTALDRKCLPKIPEYLPRPLSTENDKLLQEKFRASSSPFAPLFLLLRYTGLRISELINLPNDCILVTPKGNTYLKVPLGKMNTERLVPLSQTSLDLVEKIKTQNPLKTSRFTQQRLIGISGQVSYVYHFLAGKFKDIVGDMTDQEKSITFHRLRHTYATTLLSAGVGLFSLMKLLGHKRIEMTLRYAKVTPDHLRNEYLKAIKILESSSLLTETESLSQAASEYHPAEIINFLIAFLNKTRNNHTKNVLRRLRRIHQDLSPLSFSETFKIHVDKDKCMVR